MRGRRCLEARREWRNRERYPDLLAEQARLGICAVWQLAQRADAGLVSEFKCDEGAYTLRFVCRG